MPSALRDTYKDYSNESTRNEMLLVQITAGNIAATTAAVATLLGAEDALTLGARQRYEIVASIVSPSTALPTDPNSQRERKWLVTAKDTAGFITHYTIPCAAVKDGTGTSLLLPGSDLADLANPDWVAWISAYIAIAQSNHGNGINSVLSAQLVGRAI